MNFKKLKPTTIAALRAGHAKLRNQMKLAASTNPAKLAVHAGAKKTSSARAALPSNPMARRLMSRRP